MSPEQWARVREIFLEALDAPAEDRDALVRERAAGDAEIEAEVTRLLQGHESSLQAESGGRVLPDVRVLPRPDVRLPRSFGDFELLEEIGGGGMGAVYKARQKSLDRIVAIKVLRHPLGVSEGRLREFRGEPEKVARLRHPNIVPVHLVGETDGLPFFVMDYVPGRSLSEILVDMRRIKKERGVFALPAPLAREGTSPIARVAEAVAKIADALEYSHRQGIVHRDVKPGNILIDESGEPHLVDFGIAKRMDAETVTSRVIGTPYYMSPEQARLHAVRIDHRTDVYSLGVVLYELLTLYRPFEGDTYTQIFLAIRQIDPPAVRKRHPEVPKDLETICQKAMRKVPEERYATAGALAADLRRFLAHESPLARPPSVTARARSYVRRHALLCSVVSTMSIVSPLAWQAASRVADQGRLRAALDEAHATQATASLLGASPGEDHERAIGALEATSASLQELRRRFPEISGSDAEELRDEEAELQREAVAQAHVCRDEIAVALHPEAPGTIGTDLLELGTCLSHVSRIAALLPEGERAAIETTVQGILPRLTLDSEPEGARVTLVALDPVTEQPLRGAPRVLDGPTPLTAEPVPAGEYRIVLESPDGLRGELSAMLSEYGEEYALPKVWLRGDGEATAGMVLVPAGDYGFPEVYRDRGAMPVSPVALEGFWIDRHEVTNEQYRRFCLETGHPAPLGWPEGWNDGFSAEWERLPVAWVDVYDAEAYAAWAGKRLPTRIEWERAARGADGWQYPWGDAPNDADALRARAQVDVPRSRREEGPVAALIDPDVEDYLERVSPVESHLDDRSPEGAYDLLGNVSEWTSSPTAVLIYGAWKRDPGHRIAKGGGYRYLPGPLGRDEDVIAMAKDGSVGFRCARSQR